VLGEDCRHPSDPAQIVRAGGALLRSSASVLEPVVRQPGNSLKRREDMGRLF